MSEDFDIGDIVKLSPAITEATKSQHTKQFIVLGFRKKSDTLHAAVELMSADDGSSANVYIPKLLLEKVYCGRDLVGEISGGYDTVGML